jgi:homoserine O-acetyltransferase
MPVLTLTAGFETEAGGCLQPLQLEYGHWGLSPGRGPALWVCHALTANADVSDWWADLFGPGKTLDPEKYCIICVNNPGSPYGSTSPISIAHDGQPYGTRFPLLSIRDLAKAMQALADFLELKQIDLLVGGSMGGMIALEWSIMQPTRIKKMVLLATNARHSDWAIAFNEAQRMAINAGPAGLAAARAVAMLSYRSYSMYANTRWDQDDDRLQGFGATNYQQHQGLKLIRRFDPQCYKSLTLSMDTHHIGRGRGSISSVLKTVKAITLVIGLSSDLLFPIHEQELLAINIAGASFSVIQTDYGHDGFLTETRTVHSIIQSFLSSYA